MCVHFRHWDIVFKNMGKPIKKHLKRTTLKDNVKHTSLKEVFTLII